MNKITFWGSLYPKKKWKDLNASDNRAPGALKLTQQLAFIGDRFI
jgi:hypothetical protein